MAHIRNSTTTDLKSISRRQEYEKNITTIYSPLAGYGLPPPGGILKTILFFKPIVLQGFCNMLALW